LEVIKQCNEKGKVASRDLLSSKSKESEFVLSPQQIRRLDILESEGFVVKKAEGGQVQRSLMSE
jgi:hypothetical protein